MPAQHFVPRFATAIQASPRVEANALRALALAPEENSPAEWAPRAAAALLLGATWEGVTTSQTEVARVTGTTEEAVAKHYATLAECLKQAGNAVPGGNVDNTGRVGSTGTTGNTGTW